MWSNSYADPSFGRSQSTLKVELIHSLSCIKHIFFPLDNKKENVFVNIKLKFHSFPSFIMKSDCVN